MKEIQTSGYGIYIGKESLSLLAGDLLGKDYSEIIILVDENTREHCLPLLSLPGIKIIEVESGEHNKNIDTCREIWNGLSESGADRKSVMVNLGGGVIGDMGGFCASTYQRGIDFIQVPTTLLAMVDASVGGKLGVDMGPLKNYIGIFNEPEGVYIHPGFLKTLPKREFVAAFAEIGKHGLIADVNYWRKIQSMNLESSQSSNSDIEDLILRSIQIKSDICLSDPLEKNIRKALNFGHTIGHGIESFSMGNHTDPLIHGEAIAAGIICECWLSSEICGFPKSALNEVVGFFAKHFPPFKFEEKDTLPLLDLIRKDKKNSQSLINFTLLKEPGSFVINHTASEKQIHTALQFYKEVTSQ